MPLCKSECAITSFDSHNYLNQDFTTDREKLVNAINSLTPSNGTDFNAGLINPPAGSLLVAEKGRHKKIVVFLTDGFSSGNEDEIVEKALSINATIFCVTLGNPTPQILKNIATRTGGSYFDNVITESEAKEIYLTILQTAQGGEPCLLEWNSSGCLLDRKVEAKIPSHSLSTETIYTVSIQTLPVLEVTPSKSIKFGGVEPGKRSTKQITLIAKNKPVTVYSIANSNILYKFKDYDNSEFTLQPDESKTISIEYSPVDSAYSYARFIISSNACSGTYLYASGGYPYRPSSESTLKITHPNGLEKFGVGEDTLITWEGVTPADSVYLEYTTDGGNNWIPVANSAANLEYDWKVPDTPSNECLMRVRQFERSQRKILTMESIINNPSSLTWSPDGKRIASNSSDRVMRIWETENGKMIKNFTGFLFYNSVCWSPDGSRIAFSTSDYAVSICNANNYQITSTLLGHKKWVTSLHWSPDAGLLASGSNDGEVKIWDTNTNQNIKSFDSETGSVNQLQWNNDGSKLAIAGSNGKINIYETSNWQKIKELIKHTQSVNSISWSSDGFRLASGSSDETIKIWDTETGEVLLNTNTNKNQVKSVSWNPLAPQIAIGGTEKDILIWDIEPYSKISSLQGHSSTIESVEWSPDGSRLASGSGDNTVKIWYLDFLLQEDVSDTLCSIVKAKAIIKDIDMGYVILGTTKDSIIPDFISNVSER